MARLDLPLIPSFYPSLCTQKYAQKYAQNQLKGEMSYIIEPLVSIDFNHNNFSSNFDATQTKVLGGNFVKVCSWYDNEWAFSVRMLDIAKLYNF